VGTVAGEPEETVGVVQQLGKTIRLVDDRASSVVYGRSPGGSLWPLTLVLVAGIGLALDIFIVGFIALILLSIWIGAHR
jgi:hypothetical protein